MLIIWEHRYYGASLPEQGYENTLSPTDAASYYQYLTVEQALEDVAVFAKNFSISGWTQDLRPNATPWVFLGGSYPGNRALWSRLRNPEVTYAALSSSAPVQVKTDFWEYHVAIERMLAETPGYAGCAVDLHAVVAWMEDVYNSKKVALAERFINNATYAIYGGRYASSSNSTTAWYYRAILMDTISGTPFGDFQYEGLNGRLGLFCSNLISSEYTKITTTSVTELRATGIVVSFGLDYAVGVYAAVASEMLVAIRSGDLASAEESSGDSDPGASGINRIHMNNINKVSNDLLPGILRSDALQAKREELLMRRTTSFPRRVLNLILRRQSSSGTYIDDQTSWTFQTCSEVGYFQTGNSARSTNLVPGFVDVDYVIAAHCTPQFGSRYSTGPDGDAINAKYSGWYANVTNVYNSAGQYDPWRALSVASNVSSTVPGRRISESIPSSEDFPANGDIFGHVIVNGLHCSDLSYNVLSLQTGLGNDTNVTGNTDDSAIPDATLAHELFASALSLWLPNFTSGEARATTTLSTSPTTTSTGTQTVQTGGGVTGTSTASRSGNEGSETATTTSATTSSSTGAAPTEAAGRKGRSMAVVAVLAVLVL